MNILGIETTCDETGIAIVEDGRRVVSQIVASSALMHEKYGGIVPEVAAREQVNVIVPIIESVLHNVKLDTVDAIAVAHGPGLVGSLLIGVETAKTLAQVLAIPLIPVNHLIGHVYANWLTVDPSTSLRAGSSPASRLGGRYTVNDSLPKFPLVALIVSGGHTDLILMKSHTDFKWLGGTVDDAAGEVFDKVARALGLKYPGGPEIEKLAASYQLPETRVKFPRPMIHDGNFNFSFSGLKTAVVNFVNRSSLIVNRGKKISEIAFEFQNAIVDVLISKTINAAKKFRAQSIVVGGGVAANGFLSSQFTVHGLREKIPIYFPPKSLSVDNGAMIAAAAYYQKTYIDPLKLQANPGLHFEN